MKKCWLLVLVLAAICLVSSGLADTAITDTTFPDENFRNVVFTFDTDGNGILSDAEISAVKEIECGYRTIASLQGVELFNALEYLDCTQTGLTSINTSQNKQLKTLWCSQNNLTELDVSGNTALVQLGCASNQLTALDVSKNKKLSELYCDNNKIKKLDVSKCTNLSKLVKNGTRINSGKGYDYWANSSSWLYVDSAATVKAGGLTSKPTSAATTVTSINGIYQIKGNEAILIGPTSYTLKKLAIPNIINANGKAYMVTAIVPNACENMTKLTSIKIGMKVKTLGNRAFAGCVKLKTVSGGEGLESIGQAAFEGDVALTKFTFFEKVSIIGKSAFQNCSKLKSIVFKTTRLKAKSIGANAFKGIYAKAKVTCPAGKKEEYKRILLKKGMGKKVIFK